MILLIWHEVPENVRFYLIPEDHVAAATVIEASNHYVNSVDDENDSVIQVGEWIDEAYRARKEDQELPDTWPFPEYRQTIILDAAMGSISKVVVAGFYL